MKAADHTWQKAAVFICTKCQKAIDPKTLSQTGDIAESLKTQLKKAMNEAGRGKEIRVMTSSCLSICEDGFQAITIFPAETETSKKIESMIFHPESDYNEVLEYLKKY